jgi:undecaprenyl diphosphate synthase
MKTPKCIGFIMDGNRRFARDKSLPTFEGHSKGLEAMKDCISWGKEKGIEHLVFYAFSTENWKRSSEEVDYLMTIMEKALRSVIDSSPEERSRVRVIGQLNDLPEKLQKMIKQVEEETREEDEPTVWVALSYGGRAEIVEAVNRSIAIGESVEEASFKSHFPSSELPDPDIIVRTGGEKRLSNFLTWQSVYSELVFIDTYWPAMTREDFDAILGEYEKRQRRFGK